MLVWIKLLPSGGFGMIGKNCRYHKNKFSFETHFPEKNSFAKQIHLNFGYFDAFTWPAFSKNDDNKSLNMTVI